MYQSNEKVTIIILERGKEASIASTLYKLKIGIDEDLGIPTDLIVIDNGSSDETAKIATMAGATVVRYKHRTERSKVIEKAIDIGINKGQKITVILDRMGGNQAEDAVSLVREALKQKDNFAMGYVVPQRGEDTIGCLALDQKSLGQMDKQGEKVTEHLLEMAGSKKMRKVVFNETVESISKRKRTQNVKNRPLLKMFRHFRRNHPLKFYGFFGVIFLIGAIASGFYTVDHFYKNQSLYYPTAFITVALVMISGFLLVAGVMLNALNVLVEKVRASKKWEKASNGRWAR